MFDHIKAHHELIKSQIANTFQKSEGSKGGVVIGHTRSGKAIYRGKSIKHYKDFSKDDHMDAAVMYHRISSKQTTDHRDADEDISTMLDAHRKAGGDKDSAYVNVIEHGNKHGKEIKSKVKLVPSKDNHVEKIDGVEIHSTKPLKKSESDSALDLLMKGGDSEAKKQPKKIGKTKSDKDVYDDHDNENHKDFSAADHRDAADLLHTLANDSKNGFPGVTRAQRNKHLTSAVEKQKKEDKAKLKNAPGTGDKITTRDGVSGDVKHRDETHTYLEYAIDGEDGKKKTKISKIANEDLDSKITTGHYTHHKPTNIKKSEEDEFFAKAEGENWFERFIENEMEIIEKGITYPIGTIKKFAGREHIKTEDGWKYHGKGGGSKAQVHSNNVTNAGHGLGENAGSQHDAEVNHRQQLAEEREALIKEKTSDINFKFKMFAAAVKGVITGKFKSAIGYGTGGVGKTYTVLGQLDAAGKTAFDEEVNKPANTVANTTEDGEERDDDSVKLSVDNDTRNTDYDYVKITGYMTAPELYKTMYEHNGKILVFDDCDKVLTDGSCVNLFKGALDTSGDGSISYSTKSGVKDEEGAKLPKRFRYTGRCIFISNLKPETMPQPLKSRGVRVDLSMDRKQTIDRIRQIAKNKEGQYQNLRFPGIGKYSHSDMEKVIDYIDTHRDHLHMDDLNVRTIGKVLGLKQIADEMGEGKDWQKYADQTIFSKSDSFDYNGGLMKASQNFMNQMYKSCGDMIAAKMKEVPTYKSEDVKSGIHISQEQLNDAGDGIKVDGKIDGGDGVVEKGGVGSGKKKVNAKVSELKNNSWYHFDHKGFYGDESGRHKEVKYQGKEKEGHNFAINHGTANEHGVHLSDEEVGKYIFHQ